MQNEKKKKISYRTVCEGSHNYTGKTHTHNYLRHRNELFGISTSKKLNK